MVTNLSSTQPNNSTIKSSSLRVSSLNCRSLSKSSSPSTRQEFVRYLRNQSLDILTLQETNAGDPEMQHTLNTLFNTTSTSWTSHCGIVSLNPKITLTPTLITCDQRMIVCEITHTQRMFDPITIITIYAPAQSAARKIFYDEILTLPLFSSSSLDDQGSGDQSIILTGDFNYDLSRYRPPSEGQNVSGQRRWIQHIQQSFVNCISPDPALRTFQRGSVSSTIDYIYTTADLQPSLTSSHVEYVNHHWTDHALLVSSFRFQSTRHGKGLWRANPGLINNKFFVSSLNNGLTRLCTSFTDADTPQMQWEAIKATVKRIAQRSSRKHSSWRQNQIAWLQKKRSKILAKYSLAPDCLTSRLEPIEKQLSLLQQELVDNLALKAGKFWRENGEISAGFLKRCATRRATQTCIDELEHPVTGTRCSSPTDLQDAAISFYQQLYTPEEIHQSSVDSLLEAVPTTCRIPDSVSGSLVRPFSTVDLIDAAKRCPNHSSPGPDGIPYQILLLVFEHHHASRIATQVYNDALSRSIFPPSWQETCMTLLPKKGDLTSLKNWRPISLINTDAKVFTRLLNARLMPHLNRLISPQQLGFMPGRFIGENGKLLNVVMSVAEKTSSQAIGLLLDQEKAYDRIHPEYLRQSMSVLGIPSAVIDSLCTLFFSTSIRINVNGHLSDSFIQQRGLRQGDPISPLLFNIAFDPFLRSVNTSPDIAGFKLPPLAQETDSSVPALKIMAYADDTLVLLDDPAEMPALQTIISMYSNASNALLNFGKTEAFSLSGSTLPLWRTYLQQLSPPITSWHDKSALSPLIYLGYPVYSSVTQRNQFVDQLLTKVKLSCQIHSQRSLSIRGRVTVLNTLIYSKLWHVLRVVPLTTTQLASFRSLGSAFLNNYRFPRIAYPALVPSRKVGGLGTLDPFVQQLTLQWRWVLPLLSGSSPTSVTAPFSVQYLRAALSFFTQGDYLRPLLFSQCRSGFSSLLNNPYKILFQAVDHLPKTFLQSRLNASTCVDLPLESALISPDNLSLSPPSPSLLDSLFPNFPGIRKLVVGDIVVYDTLSRSLRLRFRSEYRRLPTLTHKVVRAIQERQLRMSPFLLRLCLPGLVPPETVEGPTNYVPLCTHSLQIVASFGTHLRPVAYRGYLLSKLFPPKAFLPPIPQPKWLTFWKLPLPLPARTTWFRLLHKAIPCKQLLHSRIPTVHPSAACIFCNFEDDITHFFFECTFKSSLWSAALHRYFPSLQLSTDQMQTSVLTVSLGMAAFETSPVIPNVSVLSLLGCILHTIWSAHWNHVFNGTRFSPTTLTQQLDRMVLRLNSALSPPPPRPTLHRLDSTP